MPHYTLPRLIRRLRLIKRDGQSVLLRDGAGGRIAGPLRWGQPVRCLVPPGKPLAAVSEVLGGDGPWLRGQLTVEPIPFLAPDDFDALLRRCDLNFCAGGILSARPVGRQAFVWQIYRQDEDAHLPKLNRFLRFIVLMLRRKWLPRSGKCSWRGILKGVGEAWVCLCRILFCCSLSSSSVVENFVGTG